MNKRQAKKGICPHGYFKNQRDYKNYLMKNGKIRHIVISRERIRYKWICKIITSDLKKQIETNVESELNHCKQKIEEKRNERK